MNRDLRSVARDGTTAIDSIAPSIVISSVNCRRCGYDLQGIAATGRCPECGLEVIETLTHVVDPTASRLPRLRDPKGTGDGLVGLTLMHLLVASSLIVPHLWPALMSILEIRVRIPLIDRVDGQLLAAGFAAVGTLFVVRLAWAPADEPAAAARTFVRWMLLGQVGLTGACLLSWAIDRAGVTLFAAQMVSEMLVIPLGVVALFGMRGVLGIVGLRSRAFRTASGGRQSVKALMAALAAILVGGVFVRTSGIMGATEIGAGALVDFTHNVGTGLFAGASLLLLVGLAYMLVNTWWIRRSLRTPPPKLGELIGPGHPAPAATGASAVGTSQSN